MNVKTIKMLLAGVGMGLCVMAACAATPTAAPGVNRPAAMYPTPAQPAPAAAAKIVTPSAGKATAHGVIVSADTGKPLVNTAVRLAEVYRQGNSDPIYVLNTASSPGTVSDGAGRYVIPDLVAREYVMFVGDPTFAYTVIRMDDGKEKIWSLAANQVMNMGTFTITLK